MGYPQDLEDYSSEEINIEFNKRIKAAIKGVCYYCNAQTIKCNCKNKGKNVLYERAPIKRTYLDY